MRSELLLGAALVVCAACQTADDPDETLGSTTAAETVLTDPPPAHPCSPHLGAKSWEAPIEGFNPCTGNLQIPLHAGVEILYNSLAAGNLGPAGYGTRFGFIDTLVEEPDGSVTRTLPTGEQLVYTASGGKLEVPTYTSPPETLTFLERRKGGMFYVRGPEGTTLNYTQYGAVHIATTLRDRIGNTVTIQIGSGNQPVAIIDPVGNRTQLVYSGGMLSSVSDAEGQVWNLTYDGNLNLVAIVQPGSRTLTFQYGENHLLTRAFSAEGHITGDWDYYLDGTLAATAEPGGRKTRITSCATSVTITNPFNESMVLAFNGNGELASVTNANGIVEMQYTYDGLRRLIGTVDWLGRSESYAYNGAHDVIQHVDRFGKITQAGWDGRHNKLWERDSTGRTSSFTYDTWGLPLTAQDAAQRTMTFTRAPNGNLLAVTGSDGKVVAAYEYGPRGEVTKVTDAVGHVTSWTYDAYTNPTTLVTRDGLRYAYSFSRLGRPLASTDPDGATKGYSYDAANRVVGASLENGGSLSLSLNQDDQPISRVDQTGPAPQTWSATYTQDGRVQGTMRNGIDDQLAPPANSVPPAADPAVCQ